MKNIILLLCLINFTGESFCQADDRNEDSNSIQLGKCVPEIIFHDNLDPEKITFSTTYLNSKPTILYFFSTVCRASFRHFAEIEEMYMAYRDSLNLMLVGIDLDDDISMTYGKYRKRYSLQLPVTFDSTVYKKLGIKTVPHVVWIDKKGIVQAVTNVLIKEYLEQFMKGIPFKFIRADKAGRENGRKFNPDEPFLVNGNGGDTSDFLQRSLFAEWKIGMPNHMPWAESNKCPLEGLKYLQVIGRSLSDLYRIAYFGKTFAWHPDDSAYGRYHYSLVLEIADKSIFEDNYNLGRNIFCYSQILPPDNRNPNHMMEVMQRDLKNSFGFEGQVETRQMPFLSLIATDSAKKKLATGGKKSHIKNSLSHIGLTNKPVSFLIATISYNLDLVRKDLPLLDETGIEGNIDISFDAVMTDFEDVRAALEKQGLRIIEKRRPMKVIVVRDPR